MQIFIPSVFVVGLLIIGLTGFLVHRTCMVEIKILKSIIYEQRLAIKHLKDIYASNEEAMAKHGNVVATAKKYKRYRKRNNQPAIKIRRSKFSKCKE